MKREFKSWEECINLREVKVGQSVMHHQFDLQLITVTNEDEAYQCGEIERSD